jgi:predicted MPP superfamily phosphohydrolase
MGNILILDSGCKLGTELARSIQAISCRASLCSDQEQVIDILRKQRVDIVILISDTQTDWKASVEALRDALSQLQNPPQIVCILCGPHQGPSDRLYGTRRGVRVIYEKP